MLNKEDIIGILNKVSLAYEEYWVLAGSGLVMFDIRELTADIDIACTSDLFNRLAINNDSVKVWHDGSRSLILEEIIEVFENWHVDEIVEVNGLPVATPASIKKHKEKLGRKKDLEDIKLIDVYLNDETEK